MENGRNMTQHWNCIFFFRIFTAYLSLQNKGPFFDRGTQVSSGTVPPRALFEFCTGYTETEKLWWEVECIV